MTATPTRQPWHPPTEPLPAPAGAVVDVSTPEQLLAAAESVQPGATIRLADGSYRMPTALALRTDGVTVRSASGDRDAVVLDGADSEHNELVTFTECRDVTVADLTIRNVFHNGFKLNSNIGGGVAGITVHNCVAHNVWQRGFKGVPGPEAADDSGLPVHPGNGKARQHVDGCVIRYCLFHNDRPKRRDDEPYERDNPQFDGNYIAAIDVMSARHWQVHDNVFVGIRGRTGRARGAIFFWQGSEDVRIEDNVIVNCDSGMWLGLAWPPDDSRRCVGYTVRGNTVARSGRAGILMSRHVDSVVRDNTVHAPPVDNPPETTDIDDGGVLIAGPDTDCRPLRIGADNDGLRVTGNLLVSARDLRVAQDAGRIEVRDNLWLQSASPDPFTDADAGDLRLSDAGQALGVGARRQT